MTMGALFHTIATAFYKLTPAQGLYPANKCRLTPLYQLLVPGHLSKLLKTGTPFLMFNSNIGSCSSMCPATLCTSSWAITKASSSSFNLLHQSSMDNIMPASRCERIDFVTVDYLKTDTFARCVMTGKIMRFEIRATRS